MGLKGFNPSEADHAFVLTPEDVKSLVKTLSNSFPTIHFAIGCRDGSQRSFDSVADLLDYDNPPSRAVQALTITAANPNDPSGYEAGFFNAGSVSMKVQVHGTPEMQSRLIAATRGLFEGVKAWYSFVPRPFIAAVFAGWAAMALVGWIRINPQDPQALPEPPIRFGEGRVVILLTVGLIVGIVAYRFWSRIFPLGTFMIGFGRSRHEHLELMRWGVIIAFGVSVCAGIAISTPVVHFVKSLF